MTLSALQGFKHCLAEHPSIVNFRWSITQTWGSTWFFIFSAIAIYIAASVTLHILLSLLLSRSRRVSLGPIPAIHSLTMALISAFISSVYFSQPPPRSATRDGSGLAPGLQLRSVAPLFSTWDALHRPRLLWSTLSTSLGSFTYSVHSSQSSSTVNSPSLRSLTNPFSCSCPSLARILSVFPSVGYTPDNFIILSGLWVPVLDCNRVAKGTFPFCSELAGCSFGLQSTLPFWSAFLAFLERWVQWDGSLGLKLCIEWRDSAVVFEVLREVTFDKEEGQHELRLMDVLVGSCIAERVPGLQNWEVDEPVMRQMLSNFKDPQDGLWLALFPEGTDFTYILCSHFPS
ncbi:hypothetical protein GH714_005800 [Hevea brasiliensis]|uniref:Uncharacterized protein n=1 Tax=Hevea brasiliensis TaxID=3981 RepID=A0A6A6MC20_HEVBR|nr:hypothetical protein GH714_005800 [Hevea brasiliensis]